MLTEGNINPPFSLLSELVKTVLDMKDLHTFKGHFLSTIINPQIMCNVKPEVCSTKYVAHVVHFFVASEGLNIPYRCIYIYFSGNTTLQAQNFFKNDQRNNILYVSHLSFQDMSVERRGGTWKLSIQAGNDIRPPKDEWLPMKN